MNINPKKQAIFKIFSQNLEWLEENKTIKFKPEFSNGYICPLCFDLFLEKDLDNSLENYLTLEDIPPKSLGGKPRALTCKSCNSKSGHELDVHLLNSLLKIDSKLFLPNSKAKAKFELDGNKINGEVSVDEKGTVHLNFLSKHSNPIEAKNFLNGMNPPRTIYNPIFYPDKIFDNSYKSPNFNMEFVNNPNERRAEIALLRIAYLIGFSTFGNGFYLNAELSKVREQILNPDKQILPKVFWIKYNFPKEMEGINIVSLPKELRCFLIIFSLKTKSESRQFSIVLPGPTDPGISVYDYIEKELCHGDGTSFLNGMLEHIPERNYLKEKKYAFISNWFWEQYTKDDYKPRLKPIKDMKE